MKNLKWQGIVFFLIIFILSVGLSFLAFNENSTEQVDKERKMAIALVNEDGGTTFNDDTITFGDEFANSVTKDSKHDWYVVSRGVAESGFERGSYDMMIVIPNDFSDRSLSIHLERPEPVALHYKINATGHEDVRSEAEKTAEQILNDFNKRLIDVYFASIIGNLQEAQDNISEIIEKEKEYTNLYNNEINSPLSNYTDQFKSVQDYTEISKDSYQGLESVLENFQTYIAEDVEDNKLFAQEIDSLINIKEDEHKTTAMFGEFFDQFDQQMRHEDVLNRLDTLKRANENVHKEFQENDQVRSIASNANVIEQHFNKMKIDVQNFKKALHEKLHNELKENVTEGLDRAFDDSYADDVSLAELFSVLDENIQAEIKQHIEAVPSLNERDIIDSGLPDQTVMDLLNVIKVTKKYNVEIANAKETQDESKEGQLISNKISEIKKGLAKKGVEISDRIDYLPAYDGEDQYFKLKLPKEFYVQQLKINGKPYKYSAEKGIKLVNPSAGDFSVTAVVKLKNQEADIDVFSPISWEWMITQEGMEEIEEDENDDPIEIDPPHEPEEEKDGSEDSSEPTNPEPESKVEQTTSVEVPVNEDEETNSGTDEAEDGKKENEEQEEIPEDQDTPPINDNPEPDPGNGKQPIKSKTIIKTNNYLHQKVQSSLVSDATNELIAATTNMVNDYYKLYSLYELYFGFNMSDKNLKDHLEDRLSNLATDDSFYHMIHRKEIKDILKDHVAKNVIDQITEDVQHSMDIIEKQVGSHIGFVEQASGNSTDLVDRISETKEHANILNNELTKMLEELAKWRDTSMEIINEKNIVLDHNRDVQTAVMQLDSGYQPLMLSSESLLEQARGNFDTADHVYQTFDAIDEQAKTIQDSGVNLVAQANELANKLTEKSIEDTDFADNFNEVLANSRIGDRQNENLYSFLANPVQTKNDGIITKGESFTAYFLVIILSIITLFTAYVLSTINEKRITANHYSEEKTLIQKNIPFASIMTGIGLIEGLIIGLVSFYLLDFDQADMFIWIGLIMIITMLLMFTSTYLLRQLKMIGMFILLSVLSLYLLLTRSLSFTFENKSVADTLRTISPLQYVETLLTNAIEGKTFATVLTFLLLVLFTGIGFVINLFVVQTSSQKKEMEDENMVEAK